MSDRRNQTRTDARIVVAIAVVLGLVMVWLFPSSGNASAGWTAQSNPAQAATSPPRPPQALRGVWFTDPLHGIAVGDNGTILRTEDGTNWDAPVQISGIQSTAPVTLYGVMFPSADVGYAVGGALIGGGSLTTAANELGVVLKTVDGGKNWVAKSMPANGHTTNAMYATWFTDASHGVVVGETQLQLDVGSPQQALYTADGGDSWGIASVPLVGPAAKVADTPTTGTGGSTPTLMGVTFTDSNNAYAVGGLLSRTKTGTPGDEGTVLKSSNGGHSWTALAATPQSLQPPSGTALQWVPGSPLNGIALVGAQPNCEAAHNCTLVAVGDHGVILKTSDSGGSWALKGTGVTAQNLNGVSFADGQHGFAVGDGGTILITADGGENWNIDRDLTHPSPPAADPTRTVAMRAVSFPHACVAYVVGDAGSILRDDLGACPAPPTPTPDTTAIPTATPTATPEATPGATATPTPTNSGPPLPLCVSSSAGAGFQPSAGTVSKMPDLVGVCTGDANPGQVTGFLADPVNRRLIQSGTHSVVLDADTYEVLGSEAQQVAQDQQAPGQNCCVLNAAIDPIDPPAAPPNGKGLIIKTDGNNGVILSSELPLGRELLRWKVPGLYPDAVQSFLSSNGLQGILPGNGENVSAVSWFGPADEAIVTSTQCRSSSALAVSAESCDVFVTAYSIRDSLAQNTGVLVWRVKVPTCQGVPVSVMGPISADRDTSGTALYVPCLIQGAPVLSTPGQSGERYAVVKMDLGASPGSGVVCQPVASDSLCPTGTSKVGIAPGLINDFFFDPTSERGFATQTNQPPVNVLVYDGKRGEFEGRANVAAPEDGNGALASVMAGVDTTTGRFYTISEHGGMTLIDGRRTPLQPPSLFPDLQTTGGRLRTLPVFPPSPMHPYTRIFVPSERNPTSLDVYADRLPVTVDPSPFGLDKLTYNGPLTPGLIPSITYGADARGFGFHSDLVGGPTGIWNGAEALPGNQSPGAHGGGFPFGPGNRDVLGAVVNTLSLQDGAGNGSASALHATDDVTRDDYGRCTGSPHECVPPVPRCFFPGDNLPCAPDPNGPIDSAKQAYRDNNGPTPLKQQWPAADAVCDSSDPRPVTASGLSVTTGTNPDGTPQLAAIPGSDQGATATVQCSIPATASAHLGALPASVPVKVGDSSITSRISPNGLDDPPQICAPGVLVPRAGSGIVVATATATARNIAVDLSGGSSGSGAVHIGEVVQTAIAWAGGRTGTAHACRQVTIKRVAVANNGSWQDICDDSCSSQSLDQLNTNFGTFVRIFTPEPDDQLFSGTPGGYTAVVAADRVQQRHDSQFNGMPPSEAAFLPGLRIEIYNSQDGSPGLSREILDFAGVQVDAQQAVQVFPLGKYQFVPSHRPAGGRPVTLGQVVPGTQVLAGVIPASASLPGLESLGSLLHHFFERLFKGFGAILRSPAEILRVLGFLCVFVLPAVLVARRRLWLTEGGGQT